MTQHTPAKFSTFVVMGSMKPPRDPDDDEDDEEDEDEEDEDEDEDEESDAPPTVHEPDED
ncbi:hypothetical protein JQ582_28560 [Bradyrhizobium japonicum]|jgi:hypothetical protein|uniref:hypothetical protein n=1 Tax=Bradyrhizobium japonicum TaxID=375 RepID=UPI001BAE3B45|nr:hypothetical protein [Bradyrhizobium japonicum]MBR0730253.1 hypothetical protein [Bradyrhizobium japonicum]MBR0747896.1 hypothetical protein [Bradyrhizobium japonicum]MBR0808967.1 hypothetical protein [Bradyrhizobium japonicum]MCP1765116.1 Ran GTPase-activating protein (RanGAP) involved in mRNA processing and transport [Bradyrhizobium japonicum]MCP1787253.1 Ran GTPase-activating protein (RanGAP) involved in mRNA processing and transport [Bradyrhizobium japonicum]